ncbi:MULTISPECIES: C1 family peptidase [unclassified Aureispira]|uniref:C1 family peptidase n=1 Tax=unclassified Aureispira TaxID=2649989 RepID=UPI000697DBD0|nr:MULTISPECIES: C1 family peptidase [unclassified Aureispira]WMX16971.1 C1 family peptidase [Aureispira sp. CCB-E]
MEKSIFNGARINTSISKELYETNSPDEVFTSENPFEQTVKILQEHAIYDWEQLYALVKNKAIEQQLISTLQLKDNTQLKTIETICERIIPSYNLEKLSGLGSIDYKLGAKRPQNFENFNDNKLKVPIYEDRENTVDVQVKMHSIDRLNNTDFTLANAVNHIHYLNPIQDQGNQRGTCTAFAVTVANELSYYMQTGRKYDLSEQHLFFETKALESDNECAAWLSSAMHIIAHKGQCEEQIWSYNPNAPCIQQYGKPSNAQSNARNFTNTYAFVNGQDILTLKQILNTNRIIPFSIPVYKSWYRSTETRRTGRITLPINGDEEISGHAMTLVGYQDDSTFEGGGYFIVRNSWGTTWAPDSYYGAGYGIIPYLYMKKYCWSALTF